jgi:hypothetical protein
MNVQDDIRRHATYMENTLRRRNKLPHSQNTIDALEHRRQGFPTPVNIINADPEGIQDALLRVLRERGARI